VGLRHDDEAVDVRVRVRSLLHAPAEPGVSRGGRLELYVDMRPNRRQAPDAYGEGVEQIFLSLARPAAAARSGRRYELAVTREPAEGGCEIGLRLRFRDFRPAGSPVPSQIGLDFMLVAAGPDGRDWAQEIYSGRRAPWQHPRQFVTAFLSP